MLVFVKVLYKQKDQRKLYKRTHFISFTCYNSFIFSVPEQTCSWVNLFLGKLGPGQTCSWANLFLGKLVPEQTCPDYFGANLFLNKLFSEQT